MRDTAALRVALYARVSSEQQVEAGTIASQVAELTQRIHADGLSVAENDCFIDDGYSGSTLVRPGLERLRDEAAQGSLDRVYVHSPDRLARNYAYQVVLVDEFKCQGVELLFLNHQLGQTPEEKMLLQVQGMVAEYERAKILERSRRGKIHAARQGRVRVLSQAPYGYRRISVAEGGGEIRYEVDFEAAQVVRQMFEWVAREGLSTAAVGRRLKDKGLKSPHGMEFWNRNSICGILKNPAYKGRAAFGRTRIGERQRRLRPSRGCPEQPRRAVSVYRNSPEQWIEIPVPPLVDAALFDEVQERLTENRLRLRERHSGARYLLQGLLLCRCCGYAFCGTGSRRARGRETWEYTYYRCSSIERYRREGKRLCENRSIRAQPLDQGVWEDLCALLNDPQRVEQEYRRRLDPPGPRQDEESLQTLVTKLKRNMGRLIDAYSEGLLDKGEFEPRLKQTRERLKRVEKEWAARVQAKMQYEELTLMVSQLDQFAKQVKSGLANCSWQERRQLILALVKRVEVDHDSIRIVYRISPEPSSETASAGPDLSNCRRRVRTAGGEAARDS